MTTTTPTTAPRKRGRPRKNPTRTERRERQGRPRLFPISASEVIDKVRAALGVSQTTLAEILRVRPSTLETWRRGDELTTTAVHRLVSLARVNPAYLRGRSRSMFLQLDNTDDDGAARLILAAFVATLDETEKRFALNFARGLQE